MQLADVDGPRRASPSRRTGSSAGRGTSDQPYSGRSAITRLKPFASTVASVARHLDRSLGPYSRIRSIERDSRSKLHRPPSSPRQRRIADAGAGQTWHVSVHPHQAAWKPSYRGAPLPPMPTGSSSCATYSRTFPQVSSWPADEGPLTRECYQRRTGAPCRSLGRG